MSYTYFSHTFLARFWRGSSVTPRGMRRRAACNARTRGAIVRLTSARHYRLLREHASIHVFAIDMSVMALECVERTCALSLSRSLTSSRHAPLRWCQTNLSCKRNLAMPFDIWHGNSSLTHISSHELMSYTQFLSRTCLSHISEYKWVIAHETWLLHAQNMIHSCATHSYVKRTNECEKTLLIHLSLSHEHSNVMRACERREFVSVWYFFCHEPQLWKQLGHTTQSLVRELRAIHQAQFDERSVRQQILARGQRHIVPDLLAKCNYSLIAVVDILVCAYVFCHVYTYIWILWCVYMYIYIVRRWCCYMCASRYASCDFVMCVFVGMCVHIYIVRRQLGFDMLAKRNHSFVAATNKYSHVHVHIIMCIHIHMYIYCSVCAYTYIFWCVYTCIFFCEYT